MTTLTEAIDRVYASMEGNPTVDEYHRRHGVKSLGVLTITDDERAGLVCDHLADRVRGKTVVEIGGGIGLLAVHLASVAKRVYVVEADPEWTSVFLAFLYYKKQKNVTFIFGAADEVAGQLAGDVALFCTHSGAADMAATAARFAPVVIDVYRDIVNDLAPEMNDLRDMAHAHDGATQ